MNIITVGIYLANNVFAVHGVDNIGKAILVKPNVLHVDLLPPSIGGIIAMAFSND